MYVVLYNIIERGKIQVSLPGRLMVGWLTLTQQILVRVQAGQCRVLLEELGNWHPACLENR